MVRLKPGVSFALCFYFNSLALPIYTKTAPRRKPHLKKNTCPQPCIKLGPILRRCVFIPVQCCFICIVWALCNTSSIRFCSIVAFANCWRTWGRSATHFVHQKRKHVIKEMRKTCHQRMRKTCHQRMREHAIKEMRKTCHQRNADNMSSKKWGQHVIKECGKHVIKEMRKTCHQRHAENMSSKKCGKHVIKDMRKTCHLRNAENMSSKKRGKYVIKDMRKTCHQRMRKTCHQRMRKTCIIPLQYYSQVLLSSGNTSWASVVTVVFKSLP